MFLLSNSNSKLKKDGIYSFGIPAGKTCPYAGACAEFCYAKKGSYRYPAVIAKRESNFKATQSENFVRDILAEITLRKIKKVRIHDSGDFYSKAYLDKWIRIATLAQSTQFYAYTKSVPFFDGVDLPKNLRIVFSFGGKHDDKIRTDSMRHSKIFDSVEELTAAGYVDSHEHDLPTLTSDSLKIGLVIH